jgi:outer membrane immunogenic protein
MRRNLIVRKIALALAAVAAFTGSAMAADLAARAPLYKAPPPVAIYNWTGFYIGVNGGGGWSNTDQYDSVLPSGLFTGPHQKGSGGFAGGTVGYNYQINNFVLGIEGDADWANIGSSVVGGALCGPLFTCSANDSFLGSIRGRAGIAANNWLFYATGGAAFSQFKYRTFFTATGADFAAPFNTSPVGWVAGAGVEYGLTPNWSIKGEYSYYGFGAQQAPTGTLTTNPVNTHTDIQVAKFGVNYRFGGPVVARY